MGSCLSKRNGETYEEEVNSIVKLGRQHKYESFNERVRKEWLEADKNRDQKLSFKEVKQMLVKLNVQVPISELRKKFKEFDVDQNGYLEYDEFKNLYDAVSSLPDLSDVFEEASGGKPEIVAEDLRRFLQSFLLSAGNGESDYSLLECAKLIVKYEGGSVKDLTIVKQVFERDPELLQEGPSLSLAGFTRLLTNGSDNSVFRPISQRVHQDMSHPLSHYFINSSHNTYLSGNQLNSDSSVESLKFALLSGVRVLEIDAWNGSNGEPIVKHGNTLTKPISFYDCIVEIKKHAFKVSEYPVIVTIENHCSIDQQRRQAEILKKELGKSLYLWEGIKSIAGSVDWKLGPEEFLSPAKLKLKVVIRDRPKARKQKDSHDTLNNESTMSESEIEAVLSSEEEIQAENQVMDDKIEEEEDLAVAPELLRLMYIKNLKISPKVTKSAVIYPDPPFASSSSFNEKKMLKLSKPGLRAKALCAYAQRNLIRIYPKGSRVDSSNYDPVPAWNSGCQVVALNYQTHSMPTWLSQGKFAENGGCGYVLKPSFMLVDPEALTWDATTTNLTPKVLRVKLISGHYLPKPIGASEKSEVIDPYVEIYLYGLKKLQKAKSKVIPNNGFKPVWNESFEFEVHVDELSLLAFVVKDKDIANDDFIGQNVIPITALRAGFRVIPLNFANGVAQDNSYLFAHFGWIA